MTIPASVELGTNFISYQFKKRLHHLVLHVTSRCNLRCQHCFVDTEPGPDLSLETYQNLGRQVGRLFWLDIGGGEPFLRKDLAEIVASFDARIAQIPSNGSLTGQMEETILRMRKMSRAEIVISLSLDGLEETHDRIRRRPGSYARTLETFKRLRRISDLPVKINTVLQNDNAAEIIEMMHEVRKYRPAFHSIILLRGEPNNPRFSLPPLAELKRLTPQIRAIQESYDYGRGRLAAGFLRNYHRYLWEVSLRTLEEKRQVVPCLAGRVHMVVWGDGRVASCELLKPVGNFLDNNWNEILKSTELRTQVRDITAGRCHCSHNCALLDSILFSPGQVAKLLCRGCC